MLRISLSVGRGSLSISRRFSLGVAIGPPPPTPDFAELLAMLL
jgi:hypothetical protein